MPVELSPDAGPTAFAEGVPVRLSERLSHFAKIANGEAVTLGDLLRSLNERSHALIALFLATPFLQPIPLPAVSTVFGLAIAAVGLQMARGRPPWLPKRLSQRPISSALVHRITKTGQRLFKRFETFVRPRIAFFHSHPWMRRLAGAVVLAGGLELSLPLPVPASNFLPAFSIALVALGSLEEDGLLVVLGFVAFVVASIFLAAIFFLPLMGVEMLAH